MERNKIFLLDAMALLYRAHFAFIKNPRITSKGLNTSAVFGFTNTLLEILNKEDPSHLAVVFDTSAPTFRHIQFPEYKAQREAMPEDLSAGIPYAVKLLECLDIPALKLDGFEADDIVGTIATQADPASCDVYMVTPDKDYAQLVKENVFLYKPRFKGGGFDVLGPPEIVEKFGLPPEQIIDFLGLKGDAVDNIPGIPKVGDKTAISLLEQFGSVEAIVERAEEITKKSVRESVIANKEQGLLSKDLATIKIDVPIEWSMERLKVGHANLDELLKLMGELEFKTTANRILNSKLNPMRPDQSKDLFGNVVGEGNFAADEAVTFSAKTLEDTEHSYHHVKTVEEQEALIKAIEKAGFCCFDSETTSLDSMQAELVGLAFSIKAGEGYYVPTPADQAQTQEIVERFKGILENPAIQKIGQNLKYDMQVMRNYGCMIQGELFDTMLAHYVNRPEAKHNMDDMARTMLNYSPVSITTLIGKKGKNQLSMRDIEPEKVVDYASEDADITLQLKEKLAPLVKDNFIFEKIEQPLMPILSDMEYEGVKVDEKALGEYSEELGERSAKLEERIYEQAEEKFNINSPKQLGVILFEKLELGKGRSAKKTKTGQYVTNEQVLSDLAYKHELPADILAYRGLKKLKSTYVDAIPKLINPKTGRVHTTFSQSVAVTGRLSSINPNLQNIPIRTQDGREVRKGFIPRDDEHVLLSADYSQVELRIMAALSKDQAMIDAFQQGLDIHRASAARVFHVSPEEVTPEQRSAAKTVNFGIIYGISAFGLSQRMDISRKEAKDIIDTYFSQYARVKAYMDESITSAKKTGYAETYFGRKRYLTDINSRNGTIRANAERNAINSPIQGTAADIIKLAMIAIHKEMTEKQLKSKMILQVHDELVFDVYKPEQEVVEELVRRNMLGVVDMEVPMEVEVGTGQTWLEAH
ncbi:MAG: DNA polymerase I [Bacteroidota bacterium]